MWCILFQSSIQRPAGKAIHAHPKFAPLASINEITVTNNNTNTSESTLLAYEAKSQPSSIAAQSVVTPSSVAAKSDVTPSSVAVESAVTSSIAAESSVTPDCVFIQGPDYTLLEGDLRNTAMLERNLLAAGLDFSYVNKMRRVCFKSIFSFLFLSVFARDFLKVNQCHVFCTIFLHQFAYILLV